MDTHSHIPLLEAALTILKSKGKSEDIANLFITTQVPAPSLLHDFLIEFSLAADPQEVEGQGCYTLEHLEKALQEYKENGTTNLLNKSH